MAGTSRQLPEIAAALGMAAASFSLNGAPSRTLTLGSAEAPTFTVGELEQLLAPHRTARFEAGFRVQSTRPVQNGVFGPARPITFCLATGASGADMLGALRDLRRDGWSSTAPIYLDDSSDTQRIIHSIRGGADSS